MYVKPIDVRRDLSNNSRFGDFVDDFELEIMDTTDTICVLHTLAYTLKLTVGVG